MSEATQKVLKEALSLSPPERAVLIDALVSSLEPSDGELDELWLAEARDRLEAYRRGELAAIPAEEVFAELNKI